MKIIKYGLIFLFIFSCSRHKVISKKDEFSNIPNFSSYVKKTKDLILKENFRGKDVVNKIAPFELKNKKKCSDGKKRGILLIHGLWSSPYETQYLADLFASECFLTRSILLPGHGTKIKNLFNIHYNEWSSSIHWHIEQLKKEVDDVHLLGFSAGAALSVHTALKRDDIKGLFLFSPALAFPWYAQLMPIAHLFSDMMKVRREDELYRYRSTDLNGALQIYYLNDEIKEILETKDSNIPTLSFMFYRDRSLNPLKAHNVLLKNFKKVEFVLYHDSKEKEYLDSFGGKTEKIESSFPEKKIYGQSHLSLILPPYDPYYGEEGEYKDCEHYKEDSDNFQVCKSNKSLWQGETIKRNLKKGPMRRLRYNPLWDHMVKTIKDFLKNNLFKKL
jgi:esterase/lipase